MSSTARLNLPFIAASQAQKEITHNEALTVLDALSHLTVLDRDLTAPPAASDGDTYVVASGGTGIGRARTARLPTSLMGPGRF
jgi:hypothetical protein